MDNVLANVEAENGVLAGIFQHGRDAYYDIADMVSDKTFTNQTNSVIYSCTKHAIEKHEVEHIDLATIFSVAQELGFDGLINKASFGKKLQELSNININIKNVRSLAAKIYKLQIARLMNSQLEKAKDQLLDVKGDEKISQILGIAENAIFDFTSLLRQGDNEPKALGRGIKEYIEYLKNNPIKQIGFPTGFQKWDESIGGGLRRGTVNVIGARPKAGKTVLTDNMGYYIAKNVGIPVLNLDTEMKKEDHQHRTLAMLSGVEINKIETGQFAQDPHFTNKVDEAGTELENVPYHHMSIAGMEFEEILAVMRRWLVKEVGLNTDGTAKDCVIIYDYLKLMDSAGIRQDLKEFQLLGFMMTALHNFTVRYDIPILCMMQLNRDGINSEDTDSASGSDRIIWLCSNFTIFKRKSDEEMAQDGPDNGTHKLITVVARHGSGMEFGNYINCHMEKWCARVKEGRTKKEIENNKKTHDLDVDDDNEDISLD